MKKTIKFTDQDQGHGGAHASGLRLTARQAEILALIRGHIAESGMPPTRAEIAQALGFGSVNAAVDHLKALAKKGYIELLPGSSRGIRLLEREDEAATELDAGLDGEVRSRQVLSDDLPSVLPGLLSHAGLPLIGRVAAGSPILAQEHVLGYHAVDPALFSPGADYLLQVRGLSMRDVGILEGDWLAVHRTQEARNGQIVVARIEDEVTVKRLHLSPGRAELLPENPDFSPIVLDLSRDPLVIEGLAVGVIRRMAGSL